ncbi:MAG: DUF2169 domain-containing protein [Polyangiaceae bacterium]|nr:DUF2169 domain-containing protein [Polyangiaceae bacterium]
MTGPIAVSPSGPIEIATLLYTRKGSVRLTALVKATFAMIHGGFCLPIDPKPISTVERPWFGGSGSTPLSMIEAWPELARPEVILWGDAVAPNREPVRALAVRLVLWKDGPRLDKTVHVFGPRSDNRHLPSPFTTIPLVWEKTAAGSRRDNPAGSTNGTVPSLIDPQKPSEPAGFAPRPLGWPGREVPWAASEAFPPQAPWEWRDDVPVDAFGSAPKDQRLDAIAGDEWIIIEGMHADLPRFATRLPKPIATARVRDEAGNADPIPLALDTILIDAHNLEVSVLFRGSVPVSSEYASSSGGAPRLVVDAELELEDPTRLDVSAIDVAQKLGKGLRLNQTATNLPAIDLPPDSRTPTPPPPAAPIADALPYKPVAPPPAIPFRAASAEVSVPEPSHAPVPPPRAPLPPASAPAARTAPPATPPPSVLPSTEAVAPPPVEPEAAPPEPAPPAARAEAEPAQSGVRAQVVARLASKSPLNDLPLAGADLSQLDLTGVSLSGLNLSNAKLVGAVLKNARMSNAKLAGADLSKADLSGADLTQADLSRTTLVDTSFEGAQLLDANLGVAEGKNVRFDGAKAQRAVLTQGKWHKCSFKEATLSNSDLSGSDLSECVFDDATLTSARLVDARATNLHATNVKIADTNLTGASFVSCDFTKADGPRTVWDRAVLDGSIFEEATLDAAGFARVHLDRASFAKATLVKASFMGVTGEAARFVEANMDGVDLRQGKLLDAAFEGARLSKVNALKATFNGARLTGADLSGASLRSAKLRNAKLDGAVLRDADLRDADLEGADLRGAERQGAKLAGASLKGAMESD